MPNNESFGDNACQPYGGNLAESSKGIAIAGLRVLVTRPVHQASPLCKMIEHEGGIAIRFPTIEIIPCHPTEQSLKIFKHLNEYHWMIFVSKNAVHMTQKAYNSDFRFPPGLKIATIGQATHKALTGFGISPDLVGNPPFTSESLLDCDEMHQVKGLNCIIVRGKNGRELLANTLRNRGALVCYAELYERRRPEVSASALFDIWQGQSIDVVTITSSEGLDNLFKMTGANGRELIKETPMLVISTRLKYKALEMGVSRVMLAREASDTALFNSLCELYQLQHKALSNEENNLGSTESRNPAS